MASRRRTEPSTQSGTAAAALKALAAAVLFGINAPLSKALLGTIAPIPMAALLYLGSGLGALLLLFVLRRAGSGRIAAAEAPLQRSDLPWLAGALLAGGVAAPIVLMFSLRVTPAATASLLLNFEGVATSLMAALAFHESIGRRVWGSIALVTLASLVLSWEPGGRLALSLGALGILAACVFWGIDNNLTRNISARNPLTIVAVKGLGAGLVSLVLALLVGQSLPRLWAALGAMVLGSVSYGLSITLFVLALRDLGAARTSALFSSAPFIGALLAFLLFREPLTVQFVVALALMIAGTLLLITERHVHEHTHGLLLHEHRHRHDDAHHTHLHLPGEVPPGGWHTHAHEHAPQTHAHPHTPDLHHRHEHGEG